MIDKTQYPHTAEPIKVRRLRHAASCAAAAALLLLGGGCSRQDSSPASAPPAAPSPQSEQTKIQEIQNNPGIPAAEKDAIMRGRQAPGPHAPVSH